MGEKQTQEAQIIDKIEDEAEEIAREILSDQKKMSIGQQLAASRSSSAQQPAPAIDESVFGPITTQNNPDSSSLEDAMIHQLSVEVEPEMVDVDKLLGENNVVGIPTDAPVHPSFPETMSQPKPTPAEITRHRRVILEKIETEIVARLESEEGTSYIHTLPLGQLLELREMVRKISN